MAQEVRFWVDPICPWCWVTARWAQQVAPQRDLDIVWKPISLLMKNATAPDSPSYDRVAWSLGLLRVMEAVRAAEGEGRIGLLYTEYGRRIHHDHQTRWPVGEALHAVGFDTKYAAAAGDESWDTPVRASMEDALALAGNDVGTPIISLERSPGDWVTAFGPVIARVPEGDDAGKLWDSFVMLASCDAFYEIKRSRTERPDPGVRP